VAYGAPLAADGSMFRGTPPPLWRTDPNPGAHPALLFDLREAASTCLISCRHTTIVIKRHKPAGAVTTE
jgi:hypothetical protein